MRVTDLIKQLPTTTQREVLDCYKRYGVGVREAIAKAIRLPLSWSNKEEGEAWTCSCSVEIDKIGYPTVIERITIDDKFALAANLQLWLPSLCGFRDRATEMIELSSRRTLTELTAIDIPGFSKNVKDSRAIADELIKQAAVEQFDLSEIILEVNQDVLGVFFFDSSEDGSRYRRKYSTQICLYWGVIGLVARLLGVSVEGLTITVLAHEYAHAYTHLGFDRSGGRWAGGAFGASEHELVEGLAQYWAAIALERLESRLPEALHAYKILLPKQPDAYRAHQPWLEQYSPDTVAAALIRLRPNGALEYEEFCNELGRIAPTAKSENSMFRKTEV